MIGQYRAIAEEATGQVGAVRQQAQMDHLETIRKTEKERTEFETQIMERTQGLVRSAKLEAKKATEKLEIEREKFAKFEVEVRRQFEAHCRNFEGQLRAKAVAILAAHNVADTNSLHNSQINRSGTTASPSSTTPYSTPSGSSIPIASNNNSSSTSSSAAANNDDRVRKTVNELKSYMATLKVGANGSETKQKSRRDTVTTAQVALFPGQQQQQQQQQQRQQQYQSPFQSSPPQQQQYQSQYQSSPQQQYQSSPQRHSQENSLGMIDAYADLSREETTNQFKSLNSLY